MTCRPWTKSEEADLRGCYGTVPAAELVFRFPLRTLGAIQHHARKLGIQHRLRNWRAICNSHKPRIVLAQVVPGEVG